MLTKTRRPTQGLAAASKNTDALAFDRRVNIGEVMEISGWSQKSIKRGVQVGSFPPPVGYIGTGTQRRRPQWLLSVALRFARGEEWSPSARVR